MPRSTAFPDIKSDFPDLEDVPTGVEFYVVADGKDYNINPADVLELAGAQGFTASYTAYVIAALDAALGEGWKAVGGGADFAIVDEDDFASNSDLAVPTQQSTKAYVDTAVAAVPAAASVTNAKLATMATATIKGRATAGTGAPEDLSAAQVRTILNVADGAQVNPTDAAIVASVNSEGGIDLASVDDLDTAGALALYDAAALTETPTAGQVRVVNSGADGFEWLTLGSMATVDAAPSGAPQAASSSSGAITLDFEGRTVIQTTTTENITTITLSNIAAYATVLWRVKQTTARNITFPAGTKIAGGALAYTGVANSSINFLIYNDNGTYEVVIGDAMTVGA